jgi:GMP synthase (glutamine-hydrolysing)
MNPAPPVINTRCTMWQATLLAMEKPSKHVSIIEHHPIEGLGIIADILKRTAIATHYIRSFEGQSVPKEMGDAAGLIIMGGPQSVYEQDTFPWLRNELRLIEDALKQTKPILGVCLGSQLLSPRWAQMSTLEEPRR